MSAFKYVVIEESLSEAEVHPPESYQRLVDESLRSAQKLIDRSATDCPACDSKHHQLAFEKSGYRYRCCESCCSLFVSPRPSAAQVDWYLHRSPAAAFRTGADYRRPLSQRGREVASLQSDWVLDLISHCTEVRATAVADFHTRHPEYFEILSQRGIDDLLAIDPLCELPPAASSRGIVDALEGTRDLDSSQCRLITAFNALEHLVDPRSFIADAFRALAPGGLIALTTRSSSGLDIQALWQHCPTVFPADHLNLLTVEGVRRLLEESGFELQEMSTPGQLDVELVARVLDENPDLDSSNSGSTRFLRYLLEHRGADTRAGLQHFLQQHLLSSHLRVIARKPTTGAHSTGGSG